MSSSPQHQGSSSSSFRSVVEMFHYRVESTPDAKAMLYRDGDQWLDMTWRQAGQRARNIACGLRSLGLGLEQRAAILSATRPEWVLADMGILAAGGATTTVYPSNTPSEIRYILADSETRVVFCEDEDQCAKLMEIREQVPEVTKVVLFKGQGPDDPWVVTLADLEKDGAAWDEANPDSYRQVADAVGPDSLATLIYTSGTTGQPKGVMLSHDCWVYEGEAIDSLGVIQPTDTQYLFLPLAHSFAKVMQLAFIRMGIPSVVDGELERLVANLGETRPTFMAAVPRIFEKVYNKVVTNAREGGAVKYRIFRWALDVGGKVSKLRQAGKEPTGLLALKYKLADRLVFTKLKALFGGRMRFFISGGAPLAREIAEFFHAADVLILEGYGLTETSAATFVNRPEKYKFGTVGPALPGTEVKIADDGEILVKGRGVMQGYYNRPEDTAEVLDDEGWIRTGDVGHLDADGYLTITDRKKDIIVTAGGKNIAPQNIEGALKTSSTMLSQILVHGDRRSYCTALVTLNEEVASKWATDNNVPFTDFVDLTKRPEVKEEVQRIIDAVNADLASYETIKKFAILEEDFSIESGELTPKMSVKRKVVEEKNRELLDSLYDGSVQRM